MTRGFFMPSFPRRRESSSLKNACEAGQLCCFDRYAGCFYCWIPACAGMTVQTILTA
jgi:hypothetical protein